jgi:hypothetical protein
MGGSGGRLVVKMTTGTRGCSVAVGGDRWRGEMQMDPRLDLLLGQR